MYKAAVNFLRGQVLVHIESGCPERVVNLCAGAEVPFWDVQWLSPVELTLRTTRRGLAQVRRAAEQVGASATVRREQGAPLLARRLRRRYVLLAAALLTVLLVVEGNFTIWEFQVSGNETVPDEAVLRALEDYGITIGTRSLDIDQKDMRNHVLLELEDVVWLAVNVRGCVARVQVVERVRGQDMVEDGPANVVARRPGLVTRVEALGGQAAVVPGDTVTQGQLLISGAVDLDNGGLRWQHGMGRVWARTWYELTAQVPLTVRQRGAPLSSRTRYALDIGKKRIKLYGKGSTLGGDCDKITQYRPVCLPWGLRLPITVAAETVTAYGPSTDLRRSAGEARQEGEALLRRQLEELLGDTGTAENVRIDAVEQGQWLLVTLRAECLEEIGREAPLTKE